MLPRTSSEREGRSIRLVVEEGVTLHNNVMSTTEGVADWICDEGLEFGQVYAFTLKRADYCARLTKSLCHSQNRRNCNPIAWTLMKASL